MSLERSGFPAARAPDVRPVDDVDEIMPVLREVASREGMAGTYLVETGYGMIGAGDTALIAVNSFHNGTVVEGVEQALRERGVKVDVLNMDLGDDREREPRDEVQIGISNLSKTSIGSDTDLHVGVFQDKYSEYLGRFRQAERTAEEQGYDLLIATHSGPFGTNPKVEHYTGDPFYYERIPWHTTESLVRPMPTTFPRDVYTRLNELTYQAIWEQGKGGEFHLSDPEGTDLTYTLQEEYVEKSLNRDETPTGLDSHYSKSHIVARPYPPTAPNEAADLSGVIASTLAHYNCPYPRIEYRVENGKVTDIDGGGEHGDLVRALHEETRDVDYPDFPGPGILWPAELAIGTTPKAIRPTADFLRHRGAGTLAERLRSGIIHIGIGTIPSGNNDPWAIEHDHPYGHVHAHLQFPTLEITTTEGETVSVIEKGRLTALDHPEVRELAAEHGDPDELLREDWIPAIPGISVEGDYDEYATDPKGYVERELR